MAELFILNNYIEDNEVDGLDLKLRTTVAIRSSDLISIVAEIHKHKFPRLI